MPDRPSVSASEEAAAREALAALGRHLYARDLIAGTAGNVSVRLSDGRLLVSPRGGHLARLPPADFVLVPPRGRHGGGPGGERPERSANAQATSGATSELPLHRACYEASPSLAAVVHTHAPALTALGSVGAPLSATILEVERAIGGIATVPFRPSGSAELGAAVGRAVGDGAGLVLMAGHGVVAVGGSLQEALDRTELGELSARAALFAAIAARSRTGADGA